MCDCKCHDDKTWDYRVVMGNRFEGLSLREVVYDKDGKIVGWNPKPSHEPMSSITEIREQLVYEMKALDNMLEGTKKPILDESKMEKGIK